MNQDTLRLVYSLNMRKANMAKDQDKPTQQPVTRTFKVGYAFAGPNGAMRNGALILHAPTQLDAQIAARNQLAKEYDWYKLTKTILFEGDSPQQKL